MSKVYLERVSAQAIEPKQATEYSAGYDIYADLSSDREITAFTPKNDSYSIDLMFGSLVLKPNHRALIPTGWKMQCEVGHCIKFYPRSGNAVKFGIRLANGTGIIDTDFPNETMVVVHNTSEEELMISNGERIAQLMVEKLDDTVFEVVSEIPKLMSIRDGGFGSTEGNING